MFSTPSTLFARWSEERNKLRNFERAHSLPGFFLCAKKSEKSLESHPKKESGRRGRRESGNTKLTRTEEEEETVPEGKEGENQVEEGSWLLFISRAGQRNRDTSPGQNELASCKCTILSRFVTCKI